MTGIFCIFKPKGVSSNRILQQIKRSQNISKIGHAGTLDPLASGILVVACGREFTKKLSESVKKEKEYIAEIKLGATSSTFDEEGEKKISNIKSIPIREEILFVLKNFIGIIDQTPPIYSAVKVKGRSAYKYARSGEHISLTSRKVEIKSIELISYEWPILKIKVITGPGVYIRSLANDIGNSLKVGGYLLDLTRTRVGDFTEDMCIPISKLISND